MINLSKKLKFALLSLFVLPTMAQVEQVKTLMVTSIAT